MQVVCQKGGCPDFRMRPVQRKVVRTRELAVDNLDTGVVQGSRDQDRIGNPAIGLRPNLLGNPLNTQQAFDPIDC